ncbi:hypothetical protein H5410_036908, partial [Solanum commersonii]
MWRFQNKIKNLSKALRKWSKECIGDVFDIVNQKEEHNKLMDEQYEMNNSDHNRILLHKSQVDYIKWLKLQYSIDSTVRWLDNTDQISQATIFSMDPNSCASPGGKKGMFFQFDWNTVKQNITDYVRAFFTKANLT